MNTPICDFVKKYSESQAVRLHMPGHKGKGVFHNTESFDITEVDGADVLYSASGIIKESMENASSLFGTAKTLYSTEGSSLSIRAMLYLAALYAKIKGKRPLILAARNVHKAFISAAALVDFDIEWLYPSEPEGLLSCKISPTRLNAYLESADKIPTALYITSPDYLGNIADIKGLSDVCKKFGVLLLVDNAHGAYLNFLDSSQHPIALGADVCCDSAHKTLPVLTGGGYLHISKNAPELFKTQAETAMSLFASTSPSYLIMQSLDYANKYMAEIYKDKLSHFLQKVKKLKAALSDKGYELFGDEDLKITICTKSYGYLGTELAEILKDNGIICEFADPDFLVFMLTPENTEDELDFLLNKLLSVEKKQALVSHPPIVSTLTRAMSVREAMFSQSVEIDVKDSSGLTLASYSVSCPPAIPIAVCGEVIDENCIKAFKYYGIKKINVLK